MVFFLGILLGERSFLGVWLCLRFFRRRLPWRRTSSVACTLLFCFTRGCGGVLKLNVGGLLIFGVRVYVIEGVLGVFEA